MYNSVTPCVCCGAEAAVFCAGCNTPFCTRACRATYRAINERDCCPLPLSVTTDDIAATAAVGEDVGIALLGGGGPNPRAWKGVSQTTFAKGMMDPLVGTTGKGRIVTVRTVEGIGREPNEVYAATRNATTGAPSDPDRIPAGHTVALVCGPVGAGVRSWELQTRGRVAAVSTMTPAQYTVTIANVDQKTGTFFGARALKITQRMQIDKRNAMTVQLDETRMSLDDDQLVVFGHGFDSSRNAVSVFWTAPAVGGGGATVAGSIYATGRSKTFCVRDGIAAVGYANDITFYRVGDGRILGKIVSPNLRDVTQLAWERNKLVAVCQGSYIFVYDTKGVPRDGQAQLVLETRVVQNVTQIALNPPLFAGYHAMGSNSKHFVAELGTGAILTEGEMTIPRSKRSIQHETLHQNGAFHDTTYTYALGNVGLVTVMPVTRK